MGTYRVEHEIHWALPDALLCILNKKKQTNLKLNQTTLNILKQNQMHWYESMTQV
jgi:flavorubredoxin